MLDLERVHGGALRDDFLQKDAKSGNLPLAVAERIERPAQDVLTVDPERQIVGAADGEHAEVAVKHEQGFAHRVHDGLREGPRILDVLERLNHAMNAPNLFHYMPNWAIIPRPYLLKLIERMELRGSEIRVQLGLMGGKGEICRPNFRLMNVATKEWQIYRGDNF